MRNKKKRRDKEIYENYWKFTAAHLNIFGTKFNNSLKIIVLFIDDNIKELEENARQGIDFSGSGLYKKLQDQIVNVSGFQGKDKTLSARKVINQFVKIGFVYPLLLGYHPLVKKFLRETDKKEKQIIFSKIFYESSSLASDVTIDNRELKHVNFLLKTLDKNEFLNKNDIMALMVTDIRNYSRGYLTREELDTQYQYVLISGFDERKYNQIAHLTGYLKRVIDLKYDKNKEQFWFAKDPAVIDQEFDKTFTRDGVKHRIFKQELKKESSTYYHKEVCYLDKKPYKTLVASHIKPLVDCLKENRESEAYDVNNGLLLSPTVDSYFDKKEISFTDEGNILFGKNVDKAVKADFQKYKLDEEILNDSRKRYLEYHRKQFEKKSGGI